MMVEKLSVSKEAWVKRSACYVCGLFGNNFLSGPVAPRQLASVQRGDVVGNAFWVPCLVGGSVGWLGLA